MDHTEIRNLKLLINELELIGYKFELNTLDRAIYKNEIVYVLKTEPLTVYSKEKNKVVKVENKRELIPYPHLDEIIWKLPFSKIHNKIEGFLEFVKQHKFNQDLVILALNYLLCVKKNSIGISGVLLDCTKKDINKKKKNSKTK